MRRYAIDACISLSIWSLIVIIHSIEWAPSTKPFTFVQLPLGPHLVKPSVKLEVARSNREMRSTNMTKFFPENQFSKFRNDMIKGKVKLACKEN